MFVYGGKLTGHFFKENPITNTYIYYIQVSRKPHTFDKNFNEFASILFPEIVCPRSHNIECSL